jgi:hypothetical protein
MTVNFNYAHDINIICYLLVYIGKVIVIKSGFWMFCISCNSSHVLYLSNPREKAFQLFDLYDYYLVMVFQKHV